jgi:hypothetical protein
LGNVARGTMVVPFCKSVARGTVGDIGYADVTDIHKHYCTCNIGIRLK